LPFMVQNQTTPNKSLKIPTVANSFLCLPKFWYACHCWSQATKCKTKKKPFQ
jgi:hypothetical protein